MEAVYNLILEFSWSLVVNREQSSGLLLPSPHFPFGAANMGYQQTPCRLGAMGTAL